MQQLAANLWTVDGPEVVFAGAPMHTRMTIVKLDDGQLWVHSPTQLNDTAESALKDIGGQVCALVAPNKLHYLFVEAWRHKFPTARVFAEPTLIRKVATLADAEELNDVAPELYGGCIEQTIFGGNRLFQEAVFFHKASRTLILTDLMINLKTDKIGPLAKLFLNFEGVVFPKGGIPRLFRWFTSDKTKARRALNTILDWHPEKITFCHGESFTQDPMTLLKSEFRWLME